MQQKQPSKGTDSVPDPDACLVVKTEDEGDAKKSHSSIGNQGSFFNNGTEGYSSSDSSDFSDDSFGDDSDELDEADTFNKTELPTV